MRDRTTRVIFFAAMLGLSAACGTSDSDTGTSGRGGSTSTTASTGTGTGGAGGVSAGGSGGASAGGSGGSSTGGAGAGASGGTTGTGGATGSGGTAGVGGSSGGGAGGVTDAGAPTDAQSSNDAGDARVSDTRGSSDVTDAGSATDAGARDTATPDASVGDAGLSPYKGVANSPCAEMATLGATWFYNWTLSRGSCAAPQFVPMLWGHTGNEQTPAGITNAINNLVSSGYTTVLGFNEPDTSTQSNISVATAISLWPSFNNPAIRIGSPATSANAAGQAWFNDFMSQVNADTTGTLRVDFIAAHWYGWNAGSCEANASSLEGYIKGLEMIPGNRPIWLTEWGCLNMSNPDSATVVAFFKGAVAMFARHPRIERYAWYPWTAYNELFTDAGISPMGAAFAAAPQYK